MNSGKTYLKKKVRKESMAGINLIRNKFLQNSNYRYKKKLNKEWFGINYITNNKINSYSI